MLLIDVRALEAGGLLVLAEPFRSPLSVAILVLALFLAVSAAVSAARDRESGTLEVLFYGPVDELAYVLGKVGGLLVAYLAALPLLLVSLVLLALMSGFMLTPKILVSLALSVVPAAEIVGFAVLLSVGTGRVRNAVLLLVGITALLFGVGVAYSMVLLVPISDSSSPLLSLRDALAALDTGIRWISPFSYLDRVVEGVMTGAWRTALLSLLAATRLYHHHDRPRGVLVAPERGAPEGRMIGAARLWAVALLLPAALGIGRPTDCAAASEQLVYWPLVTDGKEYRRIPYPQQAGAILVLADTEVVIEARRAPVSYWPITREYLADFSRNPHPVNGSLEIVDGSGEARVVEPEPYVVWYPMGVGAGPAELVHGERTLTFYDGYLQAARAADARAKEYQRIVGAQRAAVEAWLRLAAERRGRTCRPRRRSSILKSRSRSTPMRVSLEKRRCSRCPRAPTPSGCAMPTGRSCPAASVSS